MHYTVLTVSCCSLGSSSEPQTSMANPLTLNIQSTSKLLVCIFVPLMLHIEKLKNNLSLSHCAFLCFGFCFAVFVVDGLLTRDEQIILGVLLSFFLSVLLIMIICGSVK